MSFSLLAPSQERAPSLTVSSYFCQVDRHQQYVSLPTSTSSTITTNRLVLDYAMPAAAALAPWLTLVQNLSTATRASLDPLDETAAAKGVVMVREGEMCADQRGYDDKYAWMWITYHQKA